MKKLSMLQKLWLGVGVLALLSPLGVLVPVWMHAGGAWGEWGIREIERMLGFAPRGMKEEAGSWTAPMPGYALPGQGDGLGAQSMGYLVTAAAGLAATILAAYFIMKALGKGRGRGKGER